MIKLRGYQRKLVTDITSAWQLARAVLAVMATGSGKTVCFSAIMHDHKGATAAVVHRKEIVGQISLALGRLEVKHRIVAPSPVVTRIRRRHLKEFNRSFVEPQAAAGVISVQTLTSKSSDKNRDLQRWLSQVTLAVFDEGHHYVEQGLWAKAVHKMSRATLLFATATPERADGKGLGLTADGFAEKLVEGPSLQWLIDQGYLSKFKYKAPASDLDVTDIPLTASGDLNTRAMRERVVVSHLVGDVVQHYKMFCNGKKALVFATDVETALEMAQAFSCAGVNAVALSGQTDQSDRDNKLDEFEGGDLNVLVNVDLFDEGFDVPLAEGVIIARPTESLAKYLQMVGRGLRVVYAGDYDLSTTAGRLAAIAAGPKPHAIIIDPVRNWERHGMPNWPRKWSLSARERGSRGKNDELIPQRICTACTQPYERFYKQCPYCGASVPAPTARSQPEQVEGDLMELDVDAMAALFMQIQKEDMSDEEYTQDQIARGIPRIGRGADMKRHRRNKYRRAVLKELMAWWAGMQPGRPLDEIHRRFYYRFGIDMATALTLKAKDTDSLLMRIQNNFEADIYEQTTKN